MNLRMICCAGALAMAACNHVNEAPVATAQVEGAHHVVVRAEFGRIWWGHNAWSEPHELWTLPGRGDVQNLTVTRQQDGFVVTFEQDGSTFSGRFGESGPGSSTDHEFVNQLAQSGR
jgi:hypothetical protein